MKRHSLFRYFLFLITVSVTAGCGSSVLQAQLIAPRFCVVPIVDDRPPLPKNAAPSSSGMFVIPGLPSLIFADGKRTSEITAERRRISFETPFPQGYLDKWITEPWSGRIVGRALHNGVSVLRPGSGRFERIEQKNQTGLFVLPRRQLTVSVRRGLPYVVGDDALHPWLGEVELARHGIKGIRQLLDSPSLAATVVLDTEKQLHILTDDDRWVRLGGPTKQDGGTLFDSPAASAALLDMGHEILLISKSESGPFSLKTILQTEHNGAGRHFPRSNLFRQVLTYGGGVLGFNKRWQRLTAAGFEDIPGGHIGEWPRPISAIVDALTLNRTIIVGRDGLHLYDGEKIVAVAGATASRLGLVFSVTDLPSIGRALVSTANGIFELTSDARIAERAVLPLTDAPRSASLRDWPESGVALLFANNKIHALDRDLNATPVATNGMMTSGIYGVVPASGDLVVGIRGGGLAALVDGAKHPSVCSNGTP